MTPLALHASGCDELLETKADRHADRTAQAKDGETIVHSRKKRKERRREETIGREMSRRNEMNRTRVRTTAYP